MPALRAFRINWKIGSDDFVFTYLVSLLTKLVWFIATIYALAQHSLDTCSDENVIKVYLIVQTVMQFSSVIPLILTIIISAQGTIANPEPRRHIQWILYIQLILLVVEVAWDLVGAVWTFDPSIKCSPFSHLLVFTRFILIWNITTTFIIFTYLLIRIGLCQIICRFPPKKLRYEKSKPSTTYSGRRLSRLSSYWLNQHRRQRKWQWILQCLFCCHRFKNEQRNVFKEVSATLSDAFTKFRGYVLSDVLAGMSLLTLKQICAKKFEEEEKQFLKRVQFSEKGFSTNAKRLVRYLRFSIGTYGWVFHVYTKGIIGFLQLLCPCCCRKKPNKDEVEIIGDNLCRWNTTTILKWARIKEEDLVYANFKSSVYCPAYYVAIDHPENHVVVAIRGTLSVADVLSDLSAQPALLMTRDGIKFYAHKGVMEMAQNIQKKLEGEGILQKVFNAHPMYKLVITGHSLGAGVACVLGILLQPEYPKLHCYAYSPPGGLLNMAAVNHTKSFIVTVILENDLISRLSFQSFELFAQQLLQQLQNCRIPKYRIFLNHLLCRIGLYKPSAKDYYYNNPESIKMKEGRAHEEEEPFVTEDGEEELMDWSDDENENERNPSHHHISIDPITGKKMLPNKDRPLLYLPGRIIHITRGPYEKRCCGLFRRRLMLAHWSLQSKFSEIVVDKDMMTDHTPDNLLKELSKVVYL